MRRFREKMYRFMYGRYGADELYTFLTYLNIVLILLDIIIVGFIPNGIVRAIVSAFMSFLILFIFVFEIFRMMSRNIAKRRKENEIYLKIRRAVLRFFSGNTSKGTKTLNRDDLMHVFRDCTKCGSTLRLPRRAGKHNVKCPKCSHSFYVKVRPFKTK